MTRTRKEGSASILAWYRAGAAAWLKLPQPDALEMLRRINNRWIGIKDRDKNTTSHIIVAFAFCRVHNRLAAARSSLDGKESS